MAKRSQVKKKRSHRKVITRKAPGQNINISLVAPGSYPRSAGADDLGMVYERAIKEAIATANRTPVATEAAAVAENPVSDEDGLRAAIRQSREEGFGGAAAVRAYSRSESPSPPPPLLSRSNAAGGGPRFLYHAGQQLNPAQQRTADSHDAQIIELMEPEQQAALEARSAALSLRGRTSARLLRTLEVDA